MDVAPDVPAAERLRDAAPPPEVQHDGLRRARVLVTRAVEQAPPLVEALARRAIDATVVPAIEIVAVDDAALREAAGRVPAFDWVVVTSANGARAILAAGAAAAIAGHAPQAAHAGPRWACVGPATAEVLHDAGIAGTWLPSRPQARAVGEEMPLTPGQRVLVVRPAAGADPDLAASLADRGALVEEVAAYRTIEGPDASRPALRASLDAGVDAVLIASGSAARGLLALAVPDRMGDLLAVPAICIGPNTSRDAAALGFRVLGAASDGHIESLAARVAELLDPAVGVAR